MEPRLGNCKCRHEGNEVLNYEFENLLTEMDQQKEEENERALNSMIQMLDEMRRKHDNEDEHQLEENDQCENLQSENNRTYISELEKQLQESQTALLNL